MTLEIESNRASWWSEFGAESVCEHEYELQCFCGALIVTTEKTVTCASCGETLGIHRVKRKHWEIGPPPRPHRRLQLADLGKVAIRISVYLLLGYYVYDLLEAFAK
jgi:hypothetical protein